MASTSGPTPHTAARATIADVAAAAGVTKTTVSRYINGKGYVSDKTARKIAAAMHDLDFTPNRMARSLATQRTNVILYVLRGELSLITQDPGLSKHYAAATAAAAEHDYQVLCMTVNDDNAAKRLQRLLLERFADGYLYFPFSDDDPLLRMFAAGPSPVVTAGRWAVESPNITAVVNDNRAAMRDITRYLLDRGRRRLGYVSGPESVRFARQRLAGFRDAMGAAGCGGAAEAGHDGTARGETGSCAAARDAAADAAAARSAAGRSAGAESADDIGTNGTPAANAETSVTAGRAGAVTEVAGTGTVPGTSTVDAGTGDARTPEIAAVLHAASWSETAADGIWPQLQTLLPDVDGIVAANDQLAAGIIRRLQEAGYRVPDDIAVTGFDNADIAGECTPGITTVDQDLGRFGTAMAETLVDVLNGVKPPSNLAFVPTHLVARQSA